MHDETHYERLSALDQTFLAFETANAPMHVALTGIFEPGSLATEDGGVDIDRIRRHIGSRLRFIPRYRQRVVTLPLLNDAIWIDDTSFDLGYHVRHASLPRPGGERQLQRRCAEILERALDRRRPLWELWIIEGLEGGRFAMVAKVHHCMVDGIAGIDLLAALLGTEPTETIEPPDDWRPRAVPRERDVLVDEVRRRARTSLDAARRVGDWLRAPAEAGRAAGAGVTAFVRLLGKLGGAPATPFNQPIGPHRRFTWARSELATFKRIKDALGGTVNDVVLAVVTGALREWLHGRGVRTEGLELRALVPVSIRTEDERGNLGNRIAAMRGPLPVYVEDPVRRLRVVSEQMEGLKRSKQALGAEVIARFNDFAPPTLLAQASRINFSTRLFNLIVTNVPGPQIPLYVLGRELEDVFPVAFLPENHALAVAIMSYNGHVGFGLLADYDSMEDVETFAAGLEASLAELEAAAAAAAAA